MKSSGILREMRESTNDELRARVARLEEELFGHRMKRFTNQLANTMKIKEARREIARVKTILARRAAGAEQAGQKTAEAVKE
jgi:large subunit ribosomal protein L29